MPWREPRHNPVLAPAWPVLFSYVARIRAFTPVFAGYEAKRNAGTASPHTRLSRITLRSIRATVVPRSCPRGRRLGDFRPQPAEDLAGIALEDLVLVLGAEPRDLID